MISMQLLSNKQVFFGVKLYFNAFLVFKFKSVDNVSSIHFENLYILQPLLLFCEVHSSHPLLLHSMLTKHNLSLRVDFLLIILLIKYL